MPALKLRAKSENLLGSLIREVSKDSMDRPDLIPLWFGEGSRTAPAAVFAGSLGQPSTQFGEPSPSESVSGTPQPQAPGAVFAASVGQPSTQLATPSPSESVSATPQPQVPGKILFASSGQPSPASGVPSLSSSVSTSSGVPSPSVSVELAFSSNF